MKQVKLLFIIALLCTTFTHSWAINLATWTFTSLAGGTGNWGPSPFAPTSSSDSVTIVGLTRGSGVGTSSGSAAGSAWGGNTFYDGLAAGSQTAATAIAAGNFITCSVTADLGFTLSISEIAAYNIRKSSTGPSTMLWQYSLDGTNFTDIGSSFTIGTNTANVGNPEPAVALNGITALQNIPSGTTVTFRAVMWGAAQDAGTWYLNAGSGATAGSTFAVNGTIASTPLSLDLANFKGQSENNVNQLDWITVNEKNVSRFELQRGIDGMHFEKIAVLNATGNDKTASNHYTYSDVKAAVIAYYRLLMINTDGTATYSNVVMLRNDDKKQNVRIYPNPASTTLSIEGLNNVSTYSITDVSGRSIVPGTLINAEGTTTSINVSNLSQGVYFLRLVSDENKQTIRFIKK